MHSQLAQRTWTTAAFQPADGSNDTGTMILERAVEDWFVTGTLTLRSATEPAATSTYPLTGLISPTALLLVLAVADNPSSPFVYHALAKPAGDGLTASGTFVSLDDTERSFGGATFILP